ncbi:reverse transcriptase [Plakobranchus ocellatus]|uniref:Reverse transcriptase n=1 Tax=Plakobranchus ocellatus TaxID=259542 RepID=A0AAV4BRA2_9GAST|nr:reverse transcriptase [Plakobranchus ocellatus]
MQEAMIMMGVERMTATPYHPQSNGMIETLNGSLKRMLNKLVEEKWSSRMDLRSGKQTRGIHICRGVRATTAARYQDYMRNGAEESEQNLKKNRESKNMPSKFREYSKGDWILLLLPKNDNNLYIHYQSPYHTQAVGSNNYGCKIGSNLRTYHAKGAIEKEVVCSRQILKIKKNCRNKIVWPEEFLKILTYV